MFEKGYTPKRKKGKHAIGTAILLLGMVYAISATAQQPITLSAAVDTAMKNNLMVKNEILNAAYQEKLKAGAVDIPQTSLTGEFGQFNSSYKDNKFGISQSISFPTVYAKQKSLQHENYIRSVLNIAVKEAELRKQVSELFTCLFIWNSSKNYCCITTVYMRHFWKK